jgi:hypothetical protein
MSSLMDAALVRHRRSVGHGSQEAFVLIAVIGPVVVATPTP